MKAHQDDVRIRRSVLLSAALVENVRQATPPTLRDNFNRLVAVALQEYVSNRQRLLFEDAMAKMARDPEIITESARITGDFRSAEADGLPDGPQR